MAIDVSPLREFRDFRLLWTGELVSEAGHQVSVVAVFYQVTKLTGSPAAVGLVGLFQLVPLIITSIAGGSFVVRVITARADVLFSPSLSWSNVVQYDNVSENTGFNSRVRWEIDVEADSPEVHRHAIFHPSCLS